MDKADSILIKALKTATDESFGFADTAQAVNHTFSARFEKRISRILVWDEMPSYFPKLKNAFTAVALAGVLLTLMGCSVPQMRETFQDLFIDSDRYNIKLFWKENTGKNFFENYYLPSFVPGDFLLSDYYTDKNGLSALYEKCFQDGNIAKIEFYQELIPENGLFLQKQNGDFDTITVDGISMKVYRLYESTIILYEYDGYLFKIIFYEDADIRINDIAEMLGSLKIFYPEENV